MESALSAESAKPEVVKPRRVPAGETYAGAVTGRTAVPRSRAQAPTDSLDPVATAANTVTGIGTSIVGGWRGMAELARGGTLEDAVQAVHGEDENALARTFEPEGAGGKKGVAAMSSPANPLNWVGVGAKKLGEVSQDLGAGPGTATTIETGINAIPLLLGGRTGRTVQVRAPLSEVGKLPAKAGGEPMPLQTVPAGREPVPVGGAAPAASKPALKLVPTEEKPLVKNATTEAIETKPRLKGPAAELVEEKPPEFAEADEAASTKKLPLEQQQDRAALLRRVGVENVRKSALEGDKQAAADDYQQSKLNDAGGQVMKSTLEHEREALTRHAERIVEDTGGTTGMDETARMARGNAIVAPLDSLKKWFDTRTSQLYKAADESAKGVPTELPKLHEAVGGDQADFLGTTEGEALLKGVKARMKSLGMVDAEGNAQPVTVAQAEKLKQYLNDQWQPRTGRIIRRLKDSIDDDVLSSAGEDIYKQARALRAMRAATLDDPNGISRLMDASGPEGINRAVPVEKIADAVSAMPVEQLKHVVKTLRNVPKEMQPQAQQAIAEIQAHMVSKVLEEGSKQSGQWNARGVAKVLNNNSEKIGAVFSKEQIAKQKDLNDAGQILAKDQSYPGAAVQEHNLVQRGAMAAVRLGAIAAGAAIGGPIGAAVGEYLGGGAAKKMGEGASLRAAQKRVVKLSDFPK
ncbi:MAG TPA: hypothetical protein VF516_03190 [Kofleriaceae bacterium]